MHKTALGAAALVVPLFLTHGAHAAAPVPRNTIFPPWQHGQNNHATLTRRIKTRSSLSICGRPARGRDFHCPLSTLRRRESIGQCLQEGNERIFLLV
jgi:hypothetical protein